MTKQERTRELSSGINDKSYDITCFLFNTKRFIISVVSQYVCLRYFRARLYWGYLKVTCFVSRFWTERNTFSFPSYDWGYLLTDSEHGNSSLLMKSSNKV